MCKKILGKKILSAQNGMKHSEMPPPPKKKVKEKILEGEKNLLPKTEVVYNCLSCPEITFAGGGGMGPWTDTQPDRRHRRVT